MKTVYVDLAEECDAKGKWITDGGVARSETADLLFRAGIAVRKASAALTRVQAFIDYPYRDGELTPEQYAKVSEALRAIIADD